MLEVSRKRVVDHANLPLSVFSTICVHAMRAPSAEATFAGIPGRMSTAPASTPIITVLGLCKLPTTLTSDCTQPVGNWPASI